MSHACLQTKKLEAEILALTRLSKERAAEVTRMAQDFVRQQAAKEQNHLDAIERIQTLHLQHIMENTIGEWLVACCRVCW